MMTYQYVVRYQIEAACVTPLRVGPMDGDTELVLRDWRGNALIQGTSLAGAFRNWLEKADAEMADALFGNQKKVGSLMISDGIFEADSDSVLRPRLRINAEIGAAADKAKFDLAHISRGSVLHFDLLWTGKETSPEETAAIEQMLAALHSGEIKLGAQKTNGFGRVELCVKKQTFDLTNAADRECWLEENWDKAQVLELPKLQTNDQVKFVVTGYAESVLIKSAAQIKREDNNKAITGNLREKGAPVLPGSSVKGVVRARTAMIAKHLGLDDTVVNGMFGISPDTNNREIAVGQIYFRDVLLADKYVDISRIRMDRFTGGVIRKGLFTEESIGTPVELVITAPSEPIYCKLLLLALRDLGLGLYHLGSGSNIGRGYLSDVTISAATPDGRIAKLIFDKERQCTMEDPDCLFRQWMEAKVREEHE